MNTQDIEKRICNRLVRNILAAGHLISVYDGEEFAVKCSNKQRQIIQALRSTDSDTLFVRGADGSRLGVIALIYGNGCDVISDYTDTPVIQALVDSVEVRS